MSRRYATLASLMTGRGGVHEVSEDRLVALPATGGVERICQRTIETEAGHHHDSDGNQTTDETDHDMTATNAFQSHVEYVVPGVQVMGGTGNNRALHVLRLSPRWHATILADLTRRATTKTRLAHEAQERLVQGPDGGVTVSNVGGFQSMHDLLEPKTWYYTSDEEEEEEEGKSTKKGNGDEKELGAKNLSPLKGWALVSAAVCLAHDRVRDSENGEREITKHDLYGWLNANRGGDHNKLHEHGGKGSWSGVFYVRCPKFVRPNANRKTANTGTSQSSSDDTDSDSDSDDTQYGLGALGLRCHAVAQTTVGNSSACASDESEKEPPTADKTENKTETETETKIHYLEFHPSAGDLVLFRGDVLHAVESNGFCFEGQFTDSRDVDLNTIRLSIAFNEDSLANDAKEVER
tara:strand:- start:239 stop:1462 length:1224 start_codon:yes stop_codon:yes gene_type:complete